jgi:hypothetical protein
MLFQAGSRGLLPIARDDAGLRGPVVPNYSRRTLLFRDRDRAALIARIDQVIGLLAKTIGTHTEPLVNVALLSEGNEFVTYLFPRAKHRPDVFYSGELTVSPAAIDLCGVFVAPVERDFQRLTGEAIAAIFEEITLPEEQFHEIAMKLERAS